MILNSPYISGSLTVTGNTTIQGQLTVTGSLSGTASLASNALLLQGTGSTGFATTASINEVSASQQSISASLLQVSASYIALSGSYNTFSGSASTRITENSSSIQQVSSSQQQISSSQQQISASLLTLTASYTALSASYTALSGSYNVFSGSASTRTTQIENVYATTGSNSFRANQSITGSLVVSSTITAQTLVVQTVTSSIVYSSGSNIFGCDLNSRQTFTGSVIMTGSLTVNTTGPELQVNNNGVIMGNLLADNHSVTGSLRVTGSIAIFNTNCTIFGSATGDFSFNVGTTCVGTNAGIAQFFNNDYTATTRGFIRVRNSATISSTTSAFFGQGQDQKTYIYNNDPSRPGDIVITNTGKVGIGTESPIAQLHVKTDVASASRPSTLATSATNSAAYITTICGSNAGIAFGQLGANSNYIQSTYQDGSACTPLILNPYSGNVGIGTGNTAPGGALDVVTCSNTTQNFYLRNTNNLDASSRSYFNVVAGNTSLSLLVIAGGGSCGSTYIAGTCGADLYIQQAPSGNNNIVIKANGYVGINISSACKHLEVGGTIRTTVSPSVYYRDMSYLGDTYQFGSSETGDNVDFKICGGSTWSIGGNFRWFTQAGNTTPSERMRITPGGSVGIAATNPRTQLDVGDIHDGVGGTTFCAFLVAQCVWATFACVTSNDTNVVTDITYVNNNDYNRSGVFVARWAYNTACAALHIVSCLWNDSQNIGSFGLRNNGGALQICLSGGANGYRVQARVQGARATG